MEVIEAADIVKVSDNEEEFFGLESLQHAFGIQTRDGRSFLVVPEVPSQIVSKLSLSFGNE